MQGLELIHIAIQHKKAAKIDFLPLFLSKIRLKILFSAIRRF